MTLGPYVQKLITLIKWYLSKNFVFLYLETMIIYCHWTCQRENSLPRQETRNFLNIYHKPDLIYLDLKKVV